MTSKGQVTVPKVVRDALGIEAGDEVVFRVEDNRAVLARTPDFLDLAGSITVPAGSATWRGTMCSAGRGRLGRTLAVECLRGHEHPGPTPDRRPAGHGGRATAYLRSEDKLLLPDLVAAETVDVLESFTRLHVTGWRRRSGPWSRSTRSFASTRRFFSGLPRSMRPIGSTLRMLTWSPAPRAPAWAGSRPSTGRWIGSRASRESNRPRFEVLL